MYSRSFYEGTKARASVHTLLSLQDGCRDMCDLQYLVFLLKSEGHFSRHTVCAFSCGIPRALANAIHLLDVSESYVACLVNFDPIDYSS